MTRPTVAMVLAAGLGTRMRPLTDEIPKPMVKLAGRPLIDHVLDRLEAAGVTRAVVNVHYRADVLESYLKERTRPDIVISDEREQILDTGGGVVRAMPLLEADSFFIHNSDSVWLESASSILERMIEHWDEGRMDGLLLLAPLNNALGYTGPGDFEMESDGLVSRRGEASVAPFVFTGVSIAHKRLFDGGPEGVFSINTLWDRSIASGRIFGVRHDGLWMHVGTPEAVEEAGRAIDGERD